MAQTEIQQKEEAERFRVAKAREDMKTRISLGLPVPATPEEIAAQADAEAKRLAEIKGHQDQLARDAMIAKQEKSLRDRGFRVAPPSEENIEVFLNTLRIH